MKKFGGVGLRAYHFNIRQELDGRGFASAYRAGKYELVNIRHKRSEKLVEQ